MTYESSKDTKKKYRKELEDNLKKIYEVDELNVQILNNNSPYAERLKRRKLWS